MSDPRPRRWLCYSLGTAFIVGMVLVILFVWVIPMQLEWIEGRHEALERHDNVSDLFGPRYPRAPWSLIPFDEPGVGAILFAQGTDATERDRVLKLFPELGAGAVWQRDNGTVRNLR